MGRVNIAIIGLGRVGTFMLKQFLASPDLGLHVAYAVEPTDSEGSRLAHEHGIPLASVDDLIHAGIDIDFIFNLTGDEDLQREIKARLTELGNEHTELVSRHVLQILWSVMSEKRIPADKRILDSF